MINLEQALLEHHLIVLRVIGEWWELDLTGMDKADSAQALAETLQQIDLTQELVYLQPEESAALRDLIAVGGKQAVAAFSRNHGSVREMGPGRLEREEPWLDPTSPAEALWYRGFLYRGFDDTEDGLVEFYFLPNELLSQMIGGANPVVVEVPHVIKDSLPSLEGNVPKTFASAETSAVDDMTTLLAYAQRHTLGKENLQALDRYLINTEPARRALLLQLALEMGLLRRDETGLRPTRDAVVWLRDGREAQMRALADAWSGSNWNELHHVPDIVCEGSAWQNDPLLARSALLEQLPRTTSWLTVAAFVDQMKASHPDFQRPDGDYTTWYIRDVATGSYLAGFEQWDLVEGRLLVYLLTQPLHWLGLVDVGDETVRLTERALAWLGQQPLPVASPLLPLVVQPDATVIVPLQASRYERFQTARVAEWEPYLSGRPFLYRLTPRSLADAQQNGIEPKRVIDFLRRASGGQPLPASTQRAIERWAERGTEAQIQSVVIVRVQDAVILDTLRSNTKTRAYIGESLSDLVAVVRADEWLKLQQVAAQLGLLVDVATPA